MLKNYKDIAYGSVCELETQTMISGDLGSVGKERLQELREEIGDVERMLSDDQIPGKQTLGPFLPTNPHVRGGHNEE